MIHKKSCFGRTFKQNTQSSGPDGKSWSDDKFYENLRARKETAQAQHSQGKKQGVSMSALDNAFQILYRLNDSSCGLSDDDSFDIVSNPGYSNLPGNTYYDGD